MLLKKGKLVCIIQKKTKERKCNSKMHVSFVCMYDIIVKEKLVKCLVFYKQYMFLSGL